MFRLPIAFLALCGLVSPSPSPYKAFKNIRCSDGLLPTPTYGIDGAVFTVCTEGIIHASVSQIYDILLDFNKYHIWNSFVIDVKLPPTVQSSSDVKLGLSMTFTTQGLIPGVNTTSTEIVRVLSPGRHFAINAWGAGDMLNGTLIKAEHPNILSDIGGGRTRYVSYETYYLPVGLTLLPLQGSLQKEFVQQGIDLKVYIESMK